MDHNIEYKAEEFRSNLLSSLSDEYDCEMRFETTEILYNAFNDAMHFLPEMLSELDKDNANATLHAFGRHKDILLSQESFSFFNHLLESFLFKDELDESDEAIVLVDENGEELYHLKDFVGKEELVRVIAVCAIGYSWTIEYRQLQKKGIDSKVKVNRRLKGLEEDSQFYNDDEMLIRHYKMVSPEEHKQMKNELFRPALDKILNDTPHKDKIIRELTNRIFTYLKSPEDQTV